MIAGPEGDLGESHPRFRLKGLKPAKHVATPSTAGKHGAGKSQVRRGLDLEGEPRRELAWPRSGKSGAFPPCPFGKWDSVSRPSHRNTLAGAGHASPCEIRGLCRLRPRSSPPCATHALAPLYSCLVACPQHHHPPSITRTQEVIVGLSSPLTTRDN